MDHRRTIGQPFSYRILPTEKRAILLDYQNGIPCRQLGRKYHRPHSSISRLLKRNGIFVFSSYDRSKRYTLNEHYFDVIDCHKKAYWLGWLMADGYVLPNLKETRLRLQDRDLYVIQEFRKDLDSNVPITRRITKPTGLLLAQQNHKEKYSSYGISISSSIIARSLTKYGVVPSKSKTNSVPRNIPQQYLSSFLLGEFEGDGSIILRRHGFASFIVWDCESVCRFLQRIISECFGYEIGTVAKRNNSNVFEFRINKFKDIHLIYKWMYLNRDFSFCLQRKRDKFEEGLERQIKRMSKKTSKYIGVSFVKQAHKFIGSICLPHGKKIHVGTFDDQLLAAKARDKMVIEMGLANKLRLNF